MTKEPYQFTPTPTNSTVDVRWRLDVLVEWERFMQWLRPSQGLPPTTVTTPTPIWIWSALLVFLSFLYECLNLRGGIREKETGNIGRPPRSATIIYLAMFPLHLDPRAGIRMSPCWLICMAQIEWTDHPSAHTTWRKVGIDLKGPAASSPFSSTIIFNRYITLAECDLSSWDLHFITDISYGNEETDLRGVLGGGSYSMSSLELSARARESCPFKVEAS